MDDRRPKYVLEVAGSDPVAPCGYLAFDGGDLYAKSASTSDPLRVAGAPVPEQWQKVVPPAFITGGSATIVFRSEPGPARERGLADPGSAPRLPSESDWEDITRVDATTSARALASASSHVTASTAPVEVPSAPPVGRSELRTLVDVPPPAPPPPRAPSRGEQLLARVLAQWKQTPLPRKAMVALLPVAFASLSVIFAGETPAASAARTTSAGSERRGGQAATLPEAGVDAAPQLSGATPEPSPLPNVPPLSARPDGGKSDERLSVDAVVAGDYSTAAARYEQLARAYPSEPVFAEASRILSAKLDAGVR